MKDGEGIKSLNGATLLRVIMMYIPDGGDGQRIVEDVVREQGAQSQEADELPPGLFDRRIDDGERRPGGEEVRLDGGAEEVPAYEEGEGLAGGGGHPGDPQPRPEPVQRPADHLHDSDNGEGGEGCYPYSAPLITCMILITGRGRGDGGLGEG